MHKINVITPPDIIYNKNFKIFLICGNTNDRLDLKNIVEPLTAGLDIYLFEEPDYHQIDWLLNVHRLADLCIINLDMVPTDLKLLQSYLISFNHTYYITRAEFLGFNKISVNRIYGVKEVSSFIGDHVEISERPVQASL